MQKDKIEGFPGIKPYWVNHFYYKCKENLNGIIKSSLQKLQSLNALDFEDVYILVHNREHTEADQETATCIDNVISEMLKDYGYKNRAEIHLKGRSKDFYTDVTYEVNERCASKIGFEIESYYQQIRILTSPDRMARVAHSHFDVAYFFDSLFHEKYQIYQKEVNQHFVEAMKKKFEHNYQNANEKYNQWLLNEREDNKAMRGASPEAFSLHKYLRACAIPEAREPYRYPKTYLETQSKLIDRFIVWA